MKLIIAIVRREKLGAVQDAIRRPEVCVVSATEVLGEAHGPGSTGCYRGTTFRIRQPRVRLEVAVQDSCVDSTVAAILGLGYAPGDVERGDIKILVTALEAYVLSVPEGLQSEAPRRANGCPRPSWS